jgi:hypothetical protein
VKAGRRVAGAAVLWAGAFVALRVSFLAPETCPSPGSAALEAAAVAAGEWIERGEHEGRYVYEYDRADDRESEGYNIVRHAGVTMSLYQLARAGHDEFMPAADAALAEMLANLRSPEVSPGVEGLAYVDSETHARLGASALMAAALAQRREATGDDRYDSELRALGRFMIGQMTTGGQMLQTFDLRTGRPVPGETSRYSTGEAAWAFALLHNLFPAEGWDVPARQVLDYLATKRDEVEDLPYRPWADQWAAYTLAELVPDGLAEHHVAYARALAERFGMLVRTESQKESWPVAFVDPRARGGGVGVWVEGLGSLSRVAAGEPRLADLREPLAARQACGAAILADRQADASEAARWPAPDRVEGAWFRDDVTRMDDQQHALSGLLAAAGHLGPVGQ